MSEETLFRMHSALFFIILSLIAIGLIGVIALIYKTLLGI